MKPPGLNPDQQHRLLRWARATIEASISGRPLPADGPTGLTEPLGVFVTLKKRSELRGCIGIMDFERPLWDNLQRAAVASALEDPRFPPVTPDELPELRLEISVLEPPRPIARPEDFDETRHGIVIECGRHHGLFLPQVAREQGWDWETTLEMVCGKAGLPPNAWRDPAARLSVFEALVFGEESKAP